MIKLVSEKLKSVYVGVVGFSSQKFNTEQAKERIKESFDKIESHFSDRQIICVSGLTDLGVPALAYRECVKRGWMTIGVACEKAKEYDLFPVDKIIIEGKNWGDESEKFLSMLDCLIRIGGGQQSNNETQKAKQMNLLVMEYDLETAK